ncbi:MAG: pyruvate kinase [Candidatus Rifleibacteriota bacterium]
MNKRTSIVATLGPASFECDIIEELIESGANVFRLNFSHGTHASHAQYIKNIRKVSQKTGVEVGILGDLCGPKIRTGKFKDGPVELKEGNCFFLSEDPEMPGCKEGIGTSYPFLSKDLKVGNKILLDDGNLELEVIEVKQDGVLCTVLDGGLLKDKKGINMPGIDLTIDTITEKDKLDLAFMIEHEIDFIALSFVRKATDLIQLKELAGDNKIRIIAKIEKPEAVNELEQILNHCEGIMIARGDLGVEMPIQQVPAVQRHILDRCSRRGKPVITATQMLESMIDNQRPTRAETTDVFNAVLEGSDAVMLSGETASGKNPVEAVKMMSAIALEAEKLNLGKENSVDHLLPEVKREIEEIMAHAACESAYNINAEYIVPYTFSGNTAQYISKYHPPTPIIALTPRLDTCRRLSLSWGVTPILVEKISNTDEMIKYSEEILSVRNLVNPEDIIVIVAGVPLGVTGGTNLLKMHKIE